MKKKLLQSQLLRTRPQRCDRLEECAVDQDGFSINGSFPVSQPTRAERPLAWSTRAAPLALVRPITPESETPWASAPLPIVWATRARSSRMLLRARQPSARCFSIGGLCRSRGLTFGNSGRNSVNNPARTNFNMSLFKKFSAHGQDNLEFRWEVFNIFNHTQFRIYDPSHAGNTGNNIVNCYGDITTGYSAGTSSCMAGNSFLHPVDAHDPASCNSG